MPLLIVVILLYAFYSVLIVYYWLAWNSIPDFSGINVSLIKISVVAAARNEEKNISALLDALQTQSYPKELFEVIVADDHSTDRTAEIIKQHKEVKLVSLQ